MALTENCRDSMVVTTYTKYVMLTMKILFNRAVKNRGLERSRHPERSKRSMVRAFTLSGKFARELSTVIV